MEESPADESRFDAELARRSVNGGTVGEIENGISDACHHRRSESNNGFMISERSQCRQELYVLREKFAVSVHDCESRRLAA